jgi:glutathione S-transferase
MPKPPETFVPSLRAQPSVASRRRELYSEKGAVLGEGQSRVQLEHLPFSEYSWMKRNSPNGLCPWIETADGRKIAETLDICVHLANLPSAAGRPLAPITPIRKRSEKNNPW